MIIDCLKESDYDWLLENDYKIYPTDKPVTKNIIKRWYENNPEFGIVFRDHDNIVGMNITIPLNRMGWEKLVSGELIESDCNELYTFNNEKDNEIGLHVYHIRKTGDGKGFYKKALKAIDEILFKMRQKNVNLKIIGFSALCVTKMGIGLFFNRLNCRELGYVNCEHIMKKNKKIQIFKINSQDELDGKLQNGYVYLNRCKMLLIYPQNPSLIWSYIKV